MSEQGGVFLAWILSRKSDAPKGTERRLCLFNNARADHLYQHPHTKDRKFILHHGDRARTLTQMRGVRNCSPNQAYSLAAWNHLNVSFDEPKYMAESDGVEFLSS